LTAEQVFRLHERIRWAAYTTESGQVVFCKMRPGVASYTSEEVDRSFMELGPHMMLGMSERMSSSEGTGKVESVIISFKNSSILLTKLKHGFLAISADKARALRTFEEVAGSIQKLSD
jgi:hypothetical protein